jgi:hypothetical protein
MHMMYTVSEGRKTDELDRIGKEEIMAYLR